MNNKHWMNCHIFMNRKIDGFRIIILYLYSSSACSHFMFLLLNMTLFHYLPILKHLKYNMYLTRIFILHCTLHHVQISAFTISSYCIKLFLKSFLLHQYHNMSLLCRMKYILLIHMILSYQFYQFPSLRPIQNP